MAAAAIGVISPSRQQDQSNFRPSVSVIRVAYSFAVVPFKYSSSSLNLCSSKHELVSSFSTRSSHFLPRFRCSVSSEVDSRREGIAKKQRLENAMEVKPDESTNGHVLDIQISVSSERKKILSKERNPKHLNSSASRRNKLEYFQVIRYPLITESTMGNILRHNTLVFVVHEEADKKSIRDAAKKLFKVEMKKINTSIMPDGTKKAYLVLTPNHNAVDVAKKIKAI